MKKLIFSAFVSTMCIGLILPHGVEANSNVTQNTYQSDTTVQNPVFENNAKQVLKSFAQSVDYNVATNREGLNKKQLIDLYLSYGDSSDRAEYYAKLDILVTALERSTLKMDYTGAKKLDSEYIRTHPEEIEKGIFELNPDVWLSLIESNTKTRLESFNDLKELKKENPTFFAENADKDAVVKIKYPDGSIMVSSTEVVSTEASNEEIINSKVATLSNPHPTIASLGASSTPHILGPWKYVNSFNASSIYTSGINESRHTAEWIQSVSRSSVINTVKFQVKNNGSTSALNWSVQLLDTDGTANGGGVIQKLSETKAKKSSTSSYLAFGRDQYVMGYTKGSFSSSADFTAGASGFGLSFTAGATFDNYAVQEISGSALLTPYNAAAN